MLGDHEEGYSVILTEAEPEQLKSLIAAGTRPCPQAHIRLDLLKTGQSSEEPGRVDEAIAEEVQTSQPTVSRVRKQYVKEGLQAALNRRHRPGSTTES